ILLDFGVTNYNNRTISQNPAKISIFFFNIVALKSVLAIIYFLVVFLLASALGFEKRMMNLLILIGLNQFLSSIILYLRSNISGLQFYMTDSILSVLDRMIMIILCSLAIWGNILGRPVQLIDFISIQTVSYSLVIIITLFILIRKAPTMRFQLDFQMTIKIVQDCLPFALLYLLMSIYNRMDSVMLERMLPDG